MTYKIDKKNLKEFRNRINDYVLNNIDEKALSNKKYYDFLQVISWKIKNHYC